MTTFKSISSQIIDLVVDVDYLGSMDVESKYLQVAIIPWLIGQMKLIELDQKRIKTACLEIIVKKNSFSVYAKSASSSSQSININNEILSHRLTDMFK